MNKEMLELQRLCAPVIEYLKSLNPHTSIVITDSSIKVEQTQIFMPVDKEND